jgi:hypothetical protein
MRWWYEIRCEENRLVELRRGFESEQKAQKAAERAKEIIRWLVCSKESLTVVTGADADDLENGSFVPVARIKCPGAAVDTES